MHAVQGIGDLMCDAGHELSDAEHFFLLAEFGVGAIDVSADGGGEVNGDPQSAGEGGENAQQVEVVQGWRAVCVGRIVDGEAADPVEIFQEHHDTHQAGGESGEKIGRGPAQIHARDYHVEYEKEEEGISGQIGEVQEQSKGGEIEGDLPEDISFDVSFA